MYCKVCGAALNPGDVFCKNCGASNTNTNPQPVAPAVEPTPVQNVNPVGVAPVQPTAEVAQPMQSEVQPPQPEVQPEVAQPLPQQPVYTQPMQPTFTQPVQPQPVYQQPATNNEKNSGKSLMIVGIVVGLLAVAVIGYLIYSSLANRDNNGNNGGGTTVVTHNRYSIQFDGHLFNVSSDNVAVINGDKLNITTSKWQASIKGYAGNLYAYRIITEEGLRNSLASSTTITIEGIAEKTAAGLKYWQVDAYAPSDGSRATALYVQRTDGGYWVVTMANVDYSKVSATSIEEVVTMIKNAKQATTSNIETPKEVMNIPEATFSEAAPANQGSEVTE